MQTTRVPDTETLACGAAHLDRDRLVGHAEVAPTPRNLAGQPCTDRTMPVLRLVVEDAASLVFDRRQAVVQHRPGQLALVARLVVEHAVLSRRQEHARKWMSDVLEQRGAGWVITGRQR